MALPKISRGVGPQVTLFFGLHGLGGEESVAACSPLSLWAGLCPAASQKALCISEGAETPGEGEQAGATDGMVKP